MKEGFQFLYDERGKVKSVLIDLDVYPELWEDIYDTMVIESREGEPTIPWEQLKADMEEELKRQSSTDD